ncbi:MAG: hypothetical protein ABI461_02915 [Polyangiaceae bacterium]
MGSTSLRILVPAAIFVFFGAPAVCVGAATRGQNGDRLLIGVVGAIILISGLLLGFLGMARLVGEDEYIAIAADGVVLKMKSGETFHAWSTIAAIKSETSALLFQMDDDAQSIRLDGKFGGLTSNDLAARLEDWRRKAGWNLKPSDRHKK